MIKVIDPRQRETQIEYDTTGLDVRFVQQKVGPGVLDLVQVLKIEYNPAYPAHLP